MAAATSYTATASAAYGSENKPVTLTLTPNGNSTAVVTPHSTFSGAFSPSTITFDGAGGAATLTFTPTHAGAAVVSFTNSGSLTNAANVSYTVSTRHSLVKRPY